MKKYLAAMYGTGMTEEILREMITKGTLVNEYVNSIAADFDYSEAALNEYYDANAEDFVTYDVVYYYVAAQSEEVTDSEGNTTIQAVEGGVELALADVVELAAQITDRASFDKAVAAYKDGATVTEAYGAVKGSLNSVFADWTVAADRKIGDVETFTSANGAYVVMFMGMDDNKYPTTAMRHILVKSVDADADGVYSEAEMEAASVLHAPAGAVLASEKFGVQDKEILSAIRKHTIGGPKMSPLDALIYTADFIEPLRSDFPGLSEARAIAQTDIFAAMCKCAQLTNSHLESQGKRPHPRSLAMLNNYLQHEEEES